MPLIVANAINSSAINTNPVICLRIVRLVKTISPPRLVGQVTPALPAGTYRTGKAEDIPVDRSASYAGHHRHGIHAGVSTPGHHPRSLRRGNHGIPPP